MKDLLGTPVFAVMLTILTYEAGLFINKKTKVPVFNPLLISVILTMGFLIKFDISFDTYNKGGSLISFFMGPATVILAVPLYKQLDSLKKNFVPIMAGVLVGSVTAVVSIYLLARMFGLTIELERSLLPKSITTPIGIEISKQLGGIPSITMGAILVTGIVGAAFGPAICKIFRISDKTAIGIALGTSAHALGTTKAVELGEEEGAMSGLAIGIAGVMTVFIASVLDKLMFLPH